MKALLCTAFGPIDQLRLEDVAVPEPATGQVRIRVKAASLNFPDALIVQGLYQVKPALPFSPGAELAGVVDAVGEGVSAWRPGDAVIASTGFGGFAEQCVADARQIAALPPGMAFDQGAALVLTYDTSLHALQQRARLQPGETLLVLGAAGGVGLAAIEIAKALGARVIAAASSADKLALCRDAGADETIDYATEDLRRRVDALTGGRGADVVYDPVGGAYSEAALRATAWRGRFLVVGFAAGEIPKIALNLALLKERDILGVFWGDAVRRDPAQHAANMRLLAEWFAAGKVRPMITERVPLAGAADAIARMANRQVKGKVVILPDA
ncbi:NADPH:quinone oxidoreductase family protein [Burkholderia stagnalis]|uniref:NADPH:quinone oxidoreductase family protein n=1 Tax=Burkholderia stagnalis TaxID=1503054 RepID=UPI000754B19E|nr:NADPH:quinone oxidoreductase family protein [Burkholderia stagnalis]KVC58030.1 NADPH:quinone oxidoreductase [Burkholderia stagnalis]KVN11233.1 NADPH:quinone oxidoreductase [Burkholderia stagnalis]KWI67649.1 NADPH:quinone oxidoreductase [Burkholderia stagnalis]KWK61747.1 NADPH:quinone oxidoreductase [Burkholderia stagnalis]KWN22901.1 NADPH:quinone oxidoreductase [Burkholderia stagnalis]